MAASALLVSLQSAPAPARPPILGIAHVAIQSSDLARAREFYGDLLGFAERQPAQRDVAVFVINARQQLIVSGGLPPDRDERFQHVAFETDAAALRSFFTARAVDHAIVSSVPNPGLRRLSAADPDGHPVHFVTGDAGPEPSAAAPDRRISRRLLHVGLTVKDAAAADRFYKETLGFSETWRGGRPEGTISWINMRVPDGTDYLEYMLYPGAPPDRRQLGSAHHVALLVPDIQQALETVRARTARDDRNHRANPSIGVNNRWQLNVFDPDGTRVEFMEAWTVR